MKSLGLTVLSACALFVGLAATHAFEAGLGAQVPIRTDRLWFTELPPPGTRITSTIRPLLSTGSGSSSRSTRPRASPAHQWREVGSIFEYEAAYG